MGTDLANVASLSHLSKALFQEELRGQLPIWGVRKLLLSEGTEVWAETRLEKRKRKEYQTHLRTQFSLAFTQIYKAIFG